MKSLFTEDYYTYTPKANDIAQQFRELVQPLFKQLMEEDHSPRELSYLMSGEIHMIEAENVLMRNAELARKSRLVREFPTH